MKRLDPNNIDSIVIHCSASVEGKDLHASDIDKMHKQRGFEKIGYHYVICLDGSVEKGRSDDEVGVHANTKGLSGKSYNLHSLGICYVGGIGKDGKPKDTRTIEQKEAMNKLIYELLDKYPTIKEVIGHRDTSPDKNGNGEVEPKEFIKACPCFDVRSEYPMSICESKK